jgi:hypothetical protein
MVKLTAPLMSMEASGTIAKTAVFSKWKGRAYARAHVTPHNPKSSSQTGIRAMFRFLSQAWATILTATQNEWIQLAETLNVSPFNAYMRANVSRWRNFGAPAQDPDAAQDDTSATLSTWTATAGVRQIDLAIHLTTAANNWGVAIFRADTTGFSPAWSNCIAVIPLTTTDTTHFIDTPLPADTYYYKHRLFTAAGKWSTASAEVTATVS